jgi:hypothetical protein
MSKRIPLAIADYSLTVFVGESEYKAFRKRFKRISGQDIPDTPISEKGNSVGGLACLQNIWVAELKVSILAHEALHALEILYSHIGIVPHPDRVDELKAYQLQYVLERMGF